MRPLEPPIALRIYTDPKEPRALSDSGQALVTIERAAILVNGREITSALERKLALYFMLFGSWADIQQPCHVENGEMIWFEFSVTPDRQMTFDGIELIGPASSFASSKYRELTRSDGAVTGVFTDANPLACPIVPEDYKGDVLKLAIVHLHPKGPD